MPYGRLALATVTAAGCYAPDVADCVLACANDRECVHGHVCGADGWCAAPMRAGHCGAIAHDAGVQPDAPTTIELRVRVDGGGSVMIIGIGTCDEDCTWTIKPGIPRIAKAIAGEDRQFDKWTGACAGQDENCALMPTAATMITAHFRK